MKFEVVHLITTADRGGAEIQLLYLAKEQIKQGINVKVFDLKGSSELDKDFASIGITIDHRLIGKSTLTQIIEFRNFLKKSKNTVIVHCHLPLSEIIATLALPRGNVMISSRHFGGRFAPKRNAFISRIISLLFSLRARYVIAISTSVHDFLIENKEILNTNKIVTVHYGFNPQDFRKKLGEFRPVDLSNRFTIGTVARLSPEKNLQLLIRAFAHLESESKYKNRIEKLIIVGEGPLYDDLVRLCEQVRIQNKVQFLGKTDNVALVMNNIDLFVLPSFFEGFGMVLVEAMSMHRKIVATDISGLREVLGQNGAARLFKSDSLEDLIAKMDMCIEDNMEQIVINQNVQLEKFTITASAAKLYSLYKKTIKLG